LFFFFFREFYYMQMEKYAKQALAEGVKHREEASKNFKSSLILSPPLLRPIHIIPLSSSLSWW
jgi:hypothetical protein